MFCLYISFLCICNY